MPRLPLLLCTVLAAIATAAEPPRAPSAGGPTRPAARQPPDPRIAALVLPRISFREADFAGSLEYFRRKAEQQSNGALKLTFKQDVPEGFRPKHELSLEMTNVPFMVALNYLGELAGVHFAIDGVAITVQAGAAPPPQYAPLSQDAPYSVQGSSALVKPAAPASGGNNTHRKTDGTIQPEKSGYIRHRSMGGWSIKQDPDNVKSVNCSAGTPCPPPCRCFCQCARPNAKTPAK